jgi:general secretion pathway protein H
MRAPGFTLLETLVVLLVVALAATALPRLWGAGQGGLVRAAADDIAASLREARLAARAAGREARVVFDTGFGTVRPVRGPARPLPAGTRLTVEGAAAEADAEGRIAILFDAEGGSTGGRVTIALGAMAAVVEVDWMTGHVR